MEFMHIDRKISVPHRLWLMVMVFFALSCNEDVIGIMTGGQTSGSEFSPTSEVTVEFNILNPDASPDTRADKPGEWTDLDGTSAENKINNIYLFAVDYDTETGEETVEEVVKADLVPGDFTPAGVRTGHTFKLSAGTKRFYVGANMTEAHVQAFRNKEAMRADSYESALAMVMDNYETKSGDGTNILMLSSPATDGSQTDIDILSTKTLNLTATLERLVSKVMVVADYDGQYGINLADMKRSEAIPYIETDIGFFFDIQFILNNTNRASNIQKTINQSQSALFNIDPNWNIADWVTIDPANGKVRKKTMVDDGSDFSFWGTDDIEKRLSNTAEWYCSSVPSSSSDYMGQGLYCLENTAYDDPGDALVLSGTDKSDAAFLTTTHVYLKMRFAPKTVYGGSDNSTVTTSQRIYHLYYNSEKASNGDYPFTFYINKINGYFFTYTGASRWITNPQTYTKSDGTAWTWNDFEIYLGGWVYYRTLFEEGGQDDLDQDISLDGINAWGIRRNDYCILTINDIASWGDSEPGNAYIKVKSQTLNEWVNKGHNGIDITPKK